MEERENLLGMRLRYFLHSSSLNMQFPYMQWTVPFLVSLQVVWNGVQLLLGDQTGSEKGGWNYSGTSK